LRLSKNRKENHLQYEFLPAALEITETPPSPLGRIVVWTILAIFIIAIIWASIGKVDVVAVGRGKVIPDGRLKVVQPFEEGIISAIHINEGQKVKQGQVLIELDSAMKTVDVESIEKTINTMEFENKLLKNELMEGDIEELVLKDVLSEVVQQDLYELTKSKISENKAKQETFKSLILQREAELKIEQSTNQKLANNLAILKDKEQKYKVLYEGGAIELQKWKDVIDEITLAENDLQIQYAKVEQAESLLEVARKNLDNFKEEIDTTILNLVVENDKKITELKAQLTKSQRSVQYQLLTSPVDGIVHGLSSNTIGGIVTPAQPIMNIVPDGTPLVVEVMIANKDRGFVDVGQEVGNKFDAFPFQKYGTVKGEVVSISPDAFEDEKLGSVFKMKISLDRTTINLSGNNFNITPGMAVTAEIMTGKRRIIEFFLDPIIKYADESLKLR